MSSPDAQRSYPFVGLSEQAPLTRAEAACVADARSLVAHKSEDRKRYIGDNGLDPAVWMPAANWGGAQAFYETAEMLMRGGNVEFLRLLSQQFSGYALWSMQYGGPLAPADLTALNQRFAKYASSPDMEALARYESLRNQLPGYLRIGPPAKFGEVGWSVDGVIVNHDTWAYYERLLLLYRAGILDRESPKCLHAGAAVLEIGSGYGALAWYIMQAVPAIKYTALDLPESLIYAAIYLSVLAPRNDLRFLANYEFPSLVYGGRQFDLIINVLSMSEMSEAQVRVYAHGIQRLLAPDGVFFEQNQNNQSVGFINAQDIIAEYLPRRESLGCPPGLQQGYANVWRN